MARRESWEAFDAVEGELQGAFDAWRNNNNVTTRAALSAAVIRWASVLAPLIGHRAAFQFEAALTRAMDAMDRNERLLASVAAQELRGAPLDDGDVALLRQFQDDQEAALKEFFPINDATRAAVIE